MDLSNRTTKIGIGLLALLLIAGLTLFYSGSDAVAVALEKKEGILTAEQVKVAFDSVGGRMVNEAVQEGQTVKKGDVLMVIDSTDVDLATQKLKAQIAQLDATIRSQEESVRLGFSRIDNDEVQSRRSVDAQRASVTAAQATFTRQSLEYDRAVQLRGESVISQSEMDAAQAAYDTARANLAAAEEGLARLLSGAADTGNTDAMALPTIEQARSETRNRENDVEALRQQKKALEVQLKELEVSKERLTLRAPEDGRILKIIAKQGEMIAPNVPVILLESTRYYYDIYLSEKQIVNLREGDTLTGKTVAGDRKVDGTIRLIAQAPGFADLKMSREKGQADLTAFQVRVYTEPTDGVLPGMTIGVDANGFR